MNQRHSILFLVSIVFLGVISFLPVKMSEQKNTALVVDSSKVSAENIPTPSLTARSALVMDFTSGKYIFEKNSQEKLPLASLTKIVSLLTLLDIVQVDDVVKISDTAIATEGGSSLKAREHITVHDLMAMAMVESSNDAISSLVEFAGGKYNIVQNNTEEWFLNLMQKKAESLGVQNMQFFNPTGLDIIKDKTGGYGTAEDMLRIAQKSYFSDIWRFSSSERIVSKEGKTHILNPTNIIEGDISQLMGSKTGFTDIAGGNLLILFEYPINHPIGIVVLGSTNTERFEDVKKLYFYTLNVLE